MAELEFSVAASISMTSNGTTKMYLFFLLLSLGLGGNNFNNTHAATVLRQLSTQ